MGRDYPCRRGFDGCEFGAFIAIVILLFVIFSAFNGDSDKDKGKS